MAHELLASTLSYWYGLSALVFLVGRSRDDWEEERKGYGQRPEERFSSWLAWDATVIEEILLCEINFFDDQT
jgi:hypothetical protein